jgi:hypothetical protein
MNHRTKEKGKVEQKRKRKKGAQGHMNRGKRDRMRHQYHTPRGGGDMCRADRANPREIRYGYARRRSKEMR